MKHINVLLFAIIIAMVTIGSCKKDNPCENITCENGGSCNEGVCDCSSGFSGTRCETADACVNVNCANGGTCNNGTCDCPQGFSGTNCETVIVSCDTIECLNNGVCNNGNCECTPEYKGQFCDVETRARYLGTYSVTEFCSSSGMDTYNITITPVANDAAKVEIYNLFNAGYNTTGKIISQGGITIDPQNFSNVTISGYLAFSGQGVYTLTAINYTDNCNITVSF
jgi:hypothetical protein